MKAVHPGAAAGLALLSWLLACEAGDPRERILAERARFTVTLGSWAQAEDGTIRATVRVSGPVRSSLDRLTVKFVLLDGAGGTLGEEWRTLELSLVERGVPRDLELRLPGPAGAVEGLGVDTVLAPDPEELSRIVELSP